MLLEYDMGFRGCGVLLANERGSFQRALNIYLCHIHRHSN